MPVSAADTGRSRPGAAIIMVRRLSAACCTNGSCSTAAINAAALSRAAADHPSGGMSLSARYLFTVVSQPRSREFRI
eukprot:scaffold5152_cov113-Isochrysis_galbana.AAC.3